MHSDFFSSFFDSPRRTIATAEALYHRFHLFFPRKDFQYYVCLHYQCTHHGLTHHDHVQDVALAALYVSTKQHDTLKKPRELLAVLYTIRYPERAAKSKNPSGEIDIDTMDPAVSILPILLPILFLGRGKRKALLT